MSLRSQRAAQRGAALYIAVFATVVFTGIVMAMMVVTIASKDELQAGMQRTQRRYLAESGISGALVELTAGASGAIASPTSPESFGEGQFFVTVTDHGDTTFTIDSSGLVGGEMRRMRCVARDVSSGAFANAIFAGNEDGDPTYALELGGIGSQADAVDGAIYSGGDIEITGDATASGALRAGGTITGGSGEQGAYHPLPDIAAMNYDVNHDVDVAQEFRDSSPVYADGPLGGSAWELPEENPAHIFRMNPSDRSAEFLGTTKDDYFLEDPYEPVNTSSTVVKEMSTRLTLAGVGGEPGTNSNDQVFFVDGNLWLHNRPFLSLALQDTVDGVRITFVVKGNIYFSDNLLLANEPLDGIAFIAIEDDAVPDSGNIYFGDPVGGTLQRMDAFMYAQNDFYDSNLDASGSTNIVVNGMMSAGNQVAIDRDHEGTHTQLVLNHDARIAEGTLALPGLPSSGTSSSSRTMRVVALYEVSPD